MDMFSGDDFQEKLDLSNNDVSIAKGDWLHLEMNLRTVVDDGKFLSGVRCPKDLWRNLITEKKHYSSVEVVIYFLLYNNDSWMHLIFEFYSSVLLYQGYAD